MYSFAQEGSEHQRYAGAIDVYYDLNVKQSLMQAGYYMVCSTFLCAATALSAERDVFCARALVPSGGVENPLCSQSWLVLLVVRSCC